MAINGAVAALQRTSRTDDEPAVAGAPGRRRRLLHFVGIMLQLGLLALALRQFQIESNAFLRIALLCFAGFAVHFFLPMRLRLPFFVGLSLAGILLVFGLSDGLWLIGMGLALIGICHLPVRFGARVALLLVAAAALAILRTATVDLPWSHAVLPILASMFMFRLVVYMYDLRHEKKGWSMWQPLGYFFVLPNVCFPLFPVIDFKAFRRNYYDQDEMRTYQIGVSWMVRGLVHLVLYRVVYYYMTLAPHEVVDPDSLVRFLVANFLLYLRISGDFHMVVGMLHLFGFRLPETHHFYLLCSSFTDFWRRINIYWKDFMMKIFYYPTYFRLRKHGGSTAIAGATAIVFVVTWLSHSYQWFWLRADFPLIWQDALFWGLLGVVVLINSFLELRHGRKRSLDPSSWTLRDNVVLGLKTIGTFLFIIVLWSLWTCDSFESWIGMWGFLVNGVGPGGSAFPTYLLLLVAALFTGAVLFGRELKGRDQTKGSAGAGPLAAGGQTAKTVVVLAALAAIGLPQVYTRLDTNTANLVLSLRQEKLSRVDTAALERGYYEDLTRVNRFNSQLWEVYMKKPMVWLDVRGSGLTRFTGDFLYDELIPSSRSVNSFSTISTNRWGMRDQDYERVPPSGTYRMAVLGASSVMGSGVEDGEPFEAVLERSLNRDPGTLPALRYEVLNFGVPGYYPLQQRLMLERALGFQPHAVMYVATGRELSQAAHYLQEARRRGVEIPYQALREIADRAGVTQASGESEAIRLLAPYREEILRWLYTDLVARIRQTDAVPVFMFLPHMVRGGWEGETPLTLELARGAGFVVLDLDDVYGDRDRDELRIAEWDNHPNAVAHELIADRLREELEARRSELF